GALDIDGAFVAVVLAGVVFAPLGGIDGGVIDVNDAEDVLGGLGFAGDDVLVEQEGGEGGGGGDDEAGDDDPGGEAAAGGGLGSGCVGHGGWWSKVEERRSGRLEGRMSEGRGSADGAVADVAVA